MASSLTGNQQAPFRFLNLPAEVRNRIHYYTVGTFIIRTGRPYPRQHYDPGHPRSKSEWPHIGFLLTCKKFYNEAPCLLNLYWHLQLRVATLSPESGRPYLFFEIGKRSERRFNLIRNLRIEIDWRDKNCFRNYSEMYPNLDRVFHSILTNISTFFEAMAKLRHLETIKIQSVRELPRVPTRLARQGTHWGPRHVRARHEYCRFLLQPFLGLRARVPELRIGIDTEQRMYWHEGGPRMPPSSVLNLVANLEDFVAGELVDVSKIRERVERATDS